MTDHAVEQEQERVDDPAQGSEPSEPQQMSLETLETHIQEAEDLHRSLTRRLDQTNRD